MIKPAGKMSSLDEDACMIESLTAIARAIADVIFTYAALDYAQWWHKSSTWSPATFHQERRERGKKQSAPNGTAVCFRG